MRVAIIKYNAGNIQSVSYALERIGVEFVISGEPETINNADYVIFPGVGEASTTMKFLQDQKLDQLIKSLKQPVLGICLGMQLLCEFSEENNTSCLGIFNTAVKQFIPDSTHKVPHMGWNPLTQVRDWMPESAANQHVYFVHSYYVPVNPYTTAISEYGIEFTAAMRKDNFYAVQFHPEKSAQTGETILKAFLNQNQ